MKVRKPFYKANNNKQTILTQEKSYNYFTKEEQIIRQKFMIAYCLARK